MTEAIPDGLNPFTPVVELPENCICTVAINCVGALAVARRQCGEAAAAHMDLLQNIRTQADGRDAGAALESAGRMAATTLTGTLDYIERDEAVAGPLLADCPGYNEGCGLPQTKQADLTAITAKWPLPHRRRRSV